MVITTEERRKAAIKKASRSALEKRLAREREDKRAAEAVAKDEIFELSDRALARRMRDTHDDQPATPPKQASSGAPKSLISPKHRQARQSIRRLVEDLPGDDPEVTASNTQHSTLVKDGLESELKHVRVADRSAAPLDSHSSHRASVRHTAVTAVKSSPPSQPFAQERPAVRGAHQPASPPDEPRTAPATTTQLHILGLSPTAPAPATAPAAAPVTAPVTAPVMSHTHCDVVDEAYLTTQMAQFERSWGSPEGSSSRIELLESLGTPLGVSDVRTVAAVEGNPLQRELECVKVGRQPRWSI